MDFEGHSSRRSGYWCQSSFALLVVTAIFVGKMVNSYPISALILTKSSGNFVVPEQSLEISRVGNESKNFSSEEVADEVWQPSFISLFANSF
jgi:hypothetical protein